MNWVGCFNGTHKIPSLSWHSQLCHPHHCSTVVFDIHVDPDDPLIFIHIRAHTVCINVFRKSEGRRKWQSYAILSKQVQCYTHTEKLSNNDIIIAEWRGSVSQETAFIVMVPVDRRNTDFISGGNCPIFKENKSNGFSTCGANFEKLNEP